jgi:hypothetical protein
MGEDYMRFIRTLLTSAGILFLAAGPALATVVQDAPIKVEVETEPTRTVWYTNPTWLIIGGLVALVIIVLAISASRRSDTTVIR